jgi:hypothetical protein|tara:strand:+ start:77 stop:1315 length:1239 start_codon:yes stop_codon:yes gene_type:complete
MPTNNFHEITLCEVCGNDTLQSVLNLGHHPMCDDLVSIEDDRVCNEYPIEILFCKNCNTAHQRFQVPKEDLFPSTYHYRSRFTADVLNGMKSLVDSCYQRFGDMSNKTVIDIGCNDGSLLDFFREQGVTTIGVEPTEAHLDAKAKGHAVYGSFLSEKLSSEIVVAHGKADFVTFTNVFAHIEDLQEVLRSLKILMSDSTVIIIENHYLGSVLDGNQFDTFYHEHPRTYSYGSFLQMASTLDTQIAGVEFPSRYGGNIRVFLGNSLCVKYADPIDIHALIIRESNFFDDFISLRKNIAIWRRVQFKSIQEQFKKHGKLRAKAFPGRAAILVKLLGLDQGLISAVYEKPGSLKIGHYLPGTRIPICSDEELFLLPDQTLPILNLAWHIPSEIRSYLVEHEYRGTVFDIIEAPEL